MGGASASPPGGPPSRPGGGPQGLAQGLAQGPQREGPHKEAGPPRTALRYATKQTNHARRPVSKSLYCWRDLQPERVQSEGWTTTENTARGIYSCVEYFGILREYLQYVPLYPPNST